MLPFSFRSMTQLLLPVTLVAAASSAIFAEPPASSNVKNAAVKDAAVETDDKLGAELDRGPIHSSNSIIGSRIISEKGDVRGTIEDLMLDLRHGHVSTAIVELNGAEKGKSRLIAVPWNSLHWNSSDEFELRVSPKQLERAPELHRHLAPYAPIQRQPLWRSRFREILAMSQHPLRELQT